MRIVVAFVELLDKFHESIGTTGRRITIKAEQARSPQAGFARENLDSVAAEAFLDALAIEIDRLGRTGAQNSRKDAGRKLCIAHAGG